MPSAVLEALETDALENCEEMALSQKDKDWIHDEIKGALDERVPGTRSAFRDAGRTIVRWGAPAAIVSVLIGALSVMAGAVYVSVGHVKEETQFRDSVNTRLGNIEKQLETLSVSRVIENAAQASPSQVAKILPRIHDAVSQAEREKLRVDQPTLYALKSKLADVDRAVPGFWGTSLQLVAYMSRASVPREPPGAYSPLQGTYTQTQFFGPTKYIVQGTFRDVLIKDVWVKFGPNVVLENVRFENCVFVFDVKDSPALPVRKIGEQLLTATNLGDVTVS